MESKRREQNYILKTTLEYKKCAKFIVSCFLFEHFYHILYESSENLQKSGKLVIFTHERPEKNYYSETKLQIKK